MANARRKPKPRTPSLIVGLAILALSTIGGVRPSEAAPQTTASNKTSIVAVVPFTIASNHIYVIATFEGQELSLLFDTGATASYATLQGCGGATNDITGTLALAELTAPDQRFHCWKPQDGGFVGRPIDGLLGYDFTHRFVVEIDYDAERLIFHDPKSFRYKAKGLRRPINLIEDDSGGKISLLELEVEGDGKKISRGQFIVNTGARTAVTLGDRFAHQSGLAADTPGTIHALIGRGAVVHNAVMAVRRAPTIVFLGIRITNPLITVSEDKEGILAAPEFDGVIGGDLLRRCRVTFDHARSELIVEPGADLHAPFEYDMSGMFVSGDGADYHTLTVRDVVAS